MIEVIGCFSYSCQCRTLSFKFVPQIKSRYVSVIFLSTTITFQNVGRTRLAVPLATAMYKTSQKITALFYIFKDTQGSFRHRWNFFVAKKSPDFFTVCSPY